MSLEATFSALLAYLFLHEVLTIPELIGCGLMLGATVLSTTASVDEDEEEEVEEDDLESPGDDVVSSELLPHHVAKTKIFKKKFNFAETSDFLEHFLVTKQRSLRRNVFLRRSRTKSQSSIGGAPSAATGAGVSGGWITENTQLLHADGHNHSGSGSGSGSSLPTTVYGSL
jgi:hypothetical protein